VKLILLTLFFCQTAFSFNWVESGVPKNQVIIFNQNVKLKSYHKFYYENLTNQYKKYKICFKTIWEEDNKLVGIDLRCETFGLEAGESTGEQFRTIEMNRISKSDHGYLTSIAYMFGEGNDCRAVGYVDEGKQTAFVEYLRRKLYISFRIGG
jgi:hypothetical protein